MAEKSDVIRRLKRGQSMREISKETGVHRATIRSIRHAAISQGWLEENCRLPSENTILEALSTPKNESNSQVHPLDVHLPQIEEWLKEKTSFVLIHEFLSQRGVTLSETTVRRYIQRTFPGRYRKATTLRETIAGQILEVDYGFFGIVYDEDEKRNRKAWFFSGRLRHSRRAYREMVFDQRQESFFSSLINAFEHFGGIPEKVVPDNMKTAVIEASFTDPTVNRAFQKMAVFYGFLISPTLPRTPEHKGGVENDVKYTKGNFWPRYREAERQKGHSTPYAEGLQEALEKWDETIADTRIVRGLGRSPSEIFEQEEKDALMPLPLRRWSIVTLATAKVQESYRIQFDKAFYSVPYQYIGETVIVLADSATVTIYLNEKEIAHHFRATQPWEVKRSDHHAPIGVDAVCRQTKEGLLKWAGDIGEDVQRMSLAIFSRQGIDGMQSVRSLLMLGKTYGKERLNKACSRALEFKAVRYREVKQILVRELDQQDITVPIRKEQRAYRFQREEGFFDTPENDMITGEAIHG